MIYEDKKTARSHFADRRRKLPAADRERYDRIIRSRIAGLPEFAAADCVSFYAADEFEPDLLPLAAEHPEKDFMLPRYVAARREYEFALISGDSPLVRGRYGLREAAGNCPAAGREAGCSRTLHLVPGLAFDSGGVRLGRGGGFYDRLLQGVESPVCGVFYAFQLAGKLPAEAHDRRLDLAVTEREVLRFMKQTNVSERIEKHG